MRYWAAEGFTSFKVYQQISKDALAAIIDEAPSPWAACHCPSPISDLPRSRRARNRQSGARMSGQCTRLTQDDLGTDPQGPRAQSLIRLLIERNVVLTFTKVTANHSLSPDHVELLHPVRRERYEREQAAVAAGSSGSAPDRSLMRMSRRTDSRIRSCRRPPRTRLGSQQPRRRTHAGSCQP